MPDSPYLYKGLCGLARAHQVNAMTGHLGAAVLAGCFFREDHPRLPGVVGAAVEKEFERIIRGEEKWFEPERAGITVLELFQPLPEERPHEEPIPVLAGALEQNIGKLRQSGHNVIFAAIAIRALTDRPRLATPSVINGVRELILGFNGAGPGRLYFGRERGWIPGDKVALPSEGGEAPYTDEKAMVEAVMDELIRTASEHRQGCGGLWHIINHAAGLVELARLGYGGLARRGFAAHHQHMRLWGALPDLQDELGALRPASHDPRTQAFWTAGTLRRDAARLTHRIKTLYGFFTLVRLVDNSRKRKRAEEKLLYLMA